MNKQAISEVLKKSPLCSGHLIKQSGLAVEYCAMGALAKSVGATDSDLHNSDPSGTMLYDKFGPQLYDKFGIVSLPQFQSLMEKNDAAESPIVRSKKVLKEAVGLTDEELDVIFSKRVPRVIEALN